MPKARYITVFALFLALVPLCAQASSTWWDYIFPPPLEDYSRFYTQDGKTPQSAVHDMDPWTPEVWTKNRGSEKSVMDDFYINGIITDQYMDDDAPVLEVGQHFMELSGNDKRRVVEYVDSVFGVTERGGPGVIVLEHWKAREAVGVYTRQGLQLH